MPPTPQKVTCGWSASVRWRPQARPCCWSWSSCTVAIAVAERTTPGQERLPIQMLHDRVLASTEDEVGERQTGGGLVIPATASIGKRLSWAAVVAIGRNVRQVDVVDAMGRGELHADARLALWHNGIRESYDIDSVVQHGVGNSGRGARAVLAL